MGTSGTRDVDSRRISHGVLLQTGMTGQTAGLSRTSLNPNWPVRSFVSHKMANHECRVSNIQNEPAHDAPAHVFLIQSPGRPLLAEITRESVLVVRSSWEAETHRKQCRHDVVDLDFKRL
jgi:hypothetical protein